LSRPFNGERMIKGAANAATLGGFSAVKKVFKVCTGYTDRFGFMSSPASAKTNEKTPFLLDVFNDAQKRFRNAIHFATTGKFPGVPDGQGYFRVFMRVFYGMRNKVESVVKSLHDAYMQYANVLENGCVDRTHERYSMHFFFQSRECEQARDRIRGSFKQDEADILNRVEEYLLPRVSNL
jgi:hypothetical protein